MSEATLDYRHGFRVNDKKILLLVIPVLSVFFVHLGCECHFLKLIKTTFYYATLAFNVFLLISVTYYLKRLISQLSSKRPWHNEVTGRIAIQFLLGVVLPLVFVIGCCYLYSGIIGWPFRNIFRWHIELPVVLLLLVIFNLFYEWVHWTNSTHEGAQNQRLTTPGNSILLQKGRQFVAVAYVDIACFLIQHETVVVYTLKGERFLASESLSALEARVPAQFFRLNRQYLCNANAVIGYHRLDNQKLSVQLAQPVGQRVTVSKSNTRPFKDWYAQFHS